MYRKIGEKRTVLELIVLFDQEDCYFHCECRNFEFQGILCRHILSILPLVHIEKVPSKYILQRWRKDFKRKHTFIKCFYDDQLDTPIVRRFDNLCKHFNEVAESGAGSDALYNLVMDGLNELQIKTDAHHASKEIQEYHQTENNKDMVSEQGKIVLSTISVRRRGRPPSLRKKNKIGSCDKEGENEETKKIYRWSTKIYWRSTEFKREKRKDQHCCVKRCSRYQYSELNTSRGIIFTKVVLCTLNILALYPF